MSDIVIKVDGLGKRYRLGMKEQSGGGMYRYKSLRQSLGALTKRPMTTVSSALARERMDANNSFWAVRDVHFDVKRGEVVGIIGRNGAGKSTLLKILSRITKPTTGRVDLFGRLGSLLEVGTGFHPELSGRENIFLNGAILGMTRSEVKSKLDEIIAFSEIERFLDTPVKQYSSGMYMRLAFAIAAHLEPEILVVDEVLAVGDVAFQNKCLGKMKDVANEGRTVLFVSHNMAAVTLLCNRAITMTEGRAVMDRTLKEAVDRYLTLASPTTDAAAMRRTVSKAPLIEDCSAVKPRFDAKEPKQFSVRIRADERIKLPFDVIFEIFDSSGALQVQAASRFLGLLTPASASSVAYFTLRSPWLAPGTYSITIKLVHHAVYDTVEDICRFSVSEIYPYPGLTSAQDLAGQKIVPDFSCSITSNFTPLQASSGNQG